MVEPLKLKLFDLLKTLIQCLGEKCRLMDLLAISLLQTMLLYQTKKIHWPSFKGGRASTNSYLQYRIFWYVECQKTQIHTHIYKICLHKGRDKQQLLRG